ncbi:MAG: DUF1616 domain-containing protein [Thermoplasmata archaeon]
MSDPAPEHRSTIYREDGLILLFLLTLIYVGVVILTPGSRVRVPLGLVELLFAPGYALGAILFFRRPLLPVAAEFSVSVGLSVVFNVLVGLLLALVGAGVTIDLLTVADAIPVAVGLIVKVVVSSDRTVTGVGGAVARELRLPGVRPAYRPVIYVLLVAALVAFGGVVYLSVAQPPSAPGTSLALYGPDGTTATLPASLTVGEVGLVVVSISNGASNGSISLVVSAVLVGQNGSTLTPVSWAMPLALAPNTTSSLALTSLGYGQSNSQSVTFQFSQPGAYGLSFALRAAGGGPLRGATLSVTVAT